MEERTPEKQPEKDFKGIYKNVKISVKTLDFVIVGGIVLMIALVLFGIANKGYTFGGWYFDENCQYPYDFETVIVDSSTTLYAGWEPK